MNFLSVKKENTVMVGDGVNDVLAGKTAGVRTIAVLYGYSSKEKIENLQRILLPQLRRMSLIF
jgi:phosphoglycolate phosphatase-like HAD superfamily hydrolase